MTRIDRFPSTSPLDMFTVEEMNALDRGAVAAYRKDRSLNRYITPDWQSSARRLRGIRSWDPAAVVRSRVYEYAFTHPEKISGVEAWRIEADMKEWAEKELWRSRKARMHKGRPVYISPLGLGEDFDAQIVKLGQPFSKRPVPPRHVEARPAFPAPEENTDLNLDRGRAARRIPKAVRDEARPMFESGPRRPPSWPSDPTGERAAQSVYLEQQRAYFSRGIRPDGTKSATALTHAGTALLESASIPQPAQHHRQPTALEFWEVVNDGRGRRGWEGDVRRATGLSPATVEVYAPVIAPDVSRRLSGETRGLDKREFDAAVPEIIRDQTRVVLAKAFEAICARPCCTAE